MERVEGNALTCRMFLYDGSSRGTIDVTCPSSSPYRQCPLDTYGQWCGTFFDPADVESSGVTDTLSLLILPILGSITIKDRFDIMLDVSLTSLHNLFPVSFLPLMT